MESEMPMTDTTRDDLARVILAYTGSSMPDALVMASAILDALDAYNPESITPPETIDIDAALVEPLVSVDDVLGAADALSQIATALAALQDAMTGIESMP